MSNRDRKLISIILVVAIFVLGYYFLYKPITTKNKMAEEEIQTYNTELIELRGHYNKMDSYKEEIEKANKKIMLIQESLPGGLSQEQAFKLIFDIEKEFKEIEFSNIGFSPITTVGYSDEGDKAPTSTGDGDKNETEVQVGPAPVFRSITQSVTTDVNLSYADLKRFLQFIYDYEDRTVLSNLNMTLNEEDGAIGVALTLNMYGLEGEGREIEPIEFKEIPVGKPVPFNSPNVVWSSDKQNPSRPSDSAEDLFISLKPLQADGYAQVIGLSGDPRQVSYINTEEADQVRALLRIYTENGKYYANYDINGAYKEKQEFEVGTALELALFSSDRLNETDNASMYLTIINQTDLPLYINKIEEDKENPRLFINVSEGQVIED